MFYSATYVDTDSDIAILMDGVVVLALMIKAMDIDIVVVV